MQLWRKMTDYSDNSKSTYKLVIRNDDKNVYQEMDEKTTLNQREN